MLWRAVLPSVCWILPFGMVASYYYKAAAEQLGESVYFWVNLVEVACSLLSVLVSALIGEMSQPEKHGRKKVLVYLAIADTMPVAALHLTQDYRFFMLVRFLSAFIGGQLPNFAAMAVMSSWITDWSTEEQKVGFNSRMTGGMFGIIAIAPILGAAVSEAGASLDVMLKGTFLLKCLHPLVIMAVFPGTEATREARRKNFQKSELAVKDAETGESPPSPMSPKASRKLRLIEAWKYLLVRHPRPVLVSLLTFTVGKALQKNLPLYLIAELGIPQSGIAFTMTASSVITLLLQWYVLPWQSSRPGASPQFWVVAGAVATVLHTLVIGYASSALPVYACCRLPAIAAAADPVLTSLISKTRGSVTAGDVAEDQGLILGAFTGLKTLFGCLGPVLMAMLLVGDAPSRGFVLLAVMMMPAAFMAFQMYCSDIQDKKASWTQGYASAPSTGA